MKTFAYVDGYNLYHGINDKRNVMPSGTTRFSKHKPWGDLLWLNLQSFIESYTFNDVELMNIYFFEAPSHDPASLSRQQIYMNALLSLPTMDKNSFSGGEFKPRTVKCYQCGHQYTTHTEKGTDVSLAVQLIEDVALRKCEGVIIVAGDNDYLPALRAIKRIDPNLLMYVIFPPHRSSIEISSIAGAVNCRKIDYHRLERCQLPVNVTVNGFVFSKPSEYCRP